MEKPPLEFKTPRLSQLNEINALIERSKRCWNYSEDYIQKALPFIFLSNDFIENNPVFVLMDSDIVIGVSAFVMNDKEYLLEHFWIDAPLIKQGYGKILWNFTIEKAREVGMSRFLIYADPLSLPFYIRMGAVIVGERPSRVASGPVFPVLQFEF